MRCLTEGAPERVCGEGDDGGADGTRTRDLGVTGRRLDQLNYDPILCQDCEF